MNATAHNFSLCLDLAVMPESGAVAAKRYGPLLLSVVFHLAIAGAVVLLTAGGGGGGMPGNGAGKGAGSGDRMFLAGVISFQGQGQAEQKSAGHPRKDGEIFPEEASAEESAPENSTPEESAEERSVTEPPAIHRELPGTQSREPEEGIALARECVAPPPTMGKPPAGTARNEPGTPRPKNIRPTPVKTAASRATGSGRESSTPAAGPERQGAAGGSGSGGKGEATPGGGSGDMPGRGGDADGMGRPGPGLSADVDAKPKVIRRSKVRYPEHARKHKITGHVLLRFYLDEKGGVSQLQVVRSEPPGVFEEAALAAVRQWRFAPAMKDGKAIPYWVELPMPFLLQ